MNQVSNRSYLWLMVTLIALLIVGVVLYRVWDSLPVILHYVVIGLCVLGGILVLVALYLAWHHLKLHHYVRVERQQVVYQATQDREHTRQLALDRLDQEKQDREYAQFLEAEKLAIRREEIRLEQMRATLEHQRLQAAAQTIILPAGHTAVFPGDNYQRVEGLPVPQQIAAPKQQGLKEQHAAAYGTRVEEVNPNAPTVPLAGRVEAAGLPQQTKAEEDEELLPVPQAPSFREMRDMISVDRMPLCFVVEENKESPHYGLTVPMFGTIDDLLSLCVIGKPGRGKTVLLMYYTLILSVYGAEVHVFDPHGVMGELALLHGRVLPGMPPTARIYYYDRRDTMKDAVTALQAEMDARDRLYRPHMEAGELVSRKVKHPLLILADELPILADFDEQIRQEYKESNKEKKFADREEVPSLMYLIRRTVLEARKWRMFFIGSSQSIDAGILPTRVTDALNSRIVFFNSDRKARMVGLEAEFIKKMLPIIRRAGPGMTIYDCARWDRPRIGAIPNTTVEDMLDFYGVDMETLEEQWVVESQLAKASGGTGMEDAQPNTSRLRLLRRDVDTDEEDFTTRKDALQTLPDDQETAFLEENTSDRYAQEQAANRPVETPQAAQNGAMKYRLSPEQAQMFCALYPNANANKDECLKLVGANSAYRAHANELIQQYRLLEKRQQK